MMDTVKIPWDELGNGEITVKIDAGYGDGTATFSSTTNEGVDRSRTVTFRSGIGGVELVRTIRQEGRREHLYDSSGDLLKDSNNVELKALK